jgi:penicillin-binding protein 1A
MVNKKNTSSTRGKGKRTPAKKNGKHHNSKQITRQRVWRWVLNISLFGMFLLGALFVLVYIGAFGPLPTTQELEGVRNPVASEVYSSDGHLLGRYYIQNRSNVNFDQISPNVIHALVATEDSRFYEHRGIDEWALLRVFIKSILLQERSSGGGSTLSQQIAKNIFGRDNYGPLSMPVNKLRETIIAYRLEKIYTKNEILTLYLNTVPFSENTFGIETASERFFDKKPADLTVPEAATLVGTLKASNAYNPRLHPGHAKERRNLVISLMVKNNYLSEAEGEKYKKTPLTLHYNYLVYNTGPAAYLRERIRLEMEDWCSHVTKPNGNPYNLYTDGLKIYTTLDFKMQHYAEEAMQKQMKNLQDVFDKHWSNRQPWGHNEGMLKRAVQRSDRYIRMKDAGKTEQEISVAFHEKIPMKVFNWGDIQTVDMTPLDSVKHSLLTLRCGFLALSPKNGAVKVWIGGNDFRFYQYDHVTASRQVGSTFKPIVYAAALENGVEPDKYYANEEVTYPEYDDWTPHNAEDEYGGYYSLEGALSESINTVSVQVLLDAGMSNAVRLAHRMGIGADLPEVPSLALGVTAYAPFANGGKSVKPYYLLRVEDSKGRVLKTFRQDEDSDEQQVISTQTAHIITHYLEAVVDSGTGRAIRTRFGIRGNFAGKTGTTQNHADGWFIGYTPDLVTGCWVGAEDPAVHFRTLYYGQGARMALPVVGDFFHKLYSDRTFASLRYHRFDMGDDQRLIASLDIPHYRDELPHKKFIDFGRLFGRHKDKAEKDKKQRQQPDDKQSPNSEEKKHSGIWEKIRNAFRKKN